MKKVDCFKCKHFYITWEEAHPRACGFYGFKTKKIPSQVVQENSGKPCLAFEDKFPEQKPKKKGWQA